MGAHGTVVGAYATPMGFLGILCTSKLTTVGYENNEVAREPPVGSRAHQCVSHARACFQQATCGHQ